VTLQDITAVARDGGLLLLAWSLVSRVGPRLEALGARVVLLCEGIAAKVGAVVPPAPPPPASLSPPAAAGGGLLSSIVNILTGARSMKIRWPFRFAFLAAVSSALLSLASCSAVDSVSAGAKRTVCLVGNVGSAACSILTGEPAPRPMPTGIGYVPSPADLAPMPASLPAGSSCPAGGPCNLLPASDR
jgi:hypothetical protein